MAKYVVELESGTHIFVLGPEGIVHIGEPDVVYETVDGMQIGDAVINAKPYTEPDLEQVRKEAYKEGREAGIKDGKCEAWEAARKISLAKIDGGFSWESMNNMFGTDSPSKIYKTFTAPEAIEKIRQYEQEQEEIQVGDEVITASGKAVVTGVGPVHFEYDYADGSHGYDEVKNAKKTGRHFPEIAEVLRKMKETANED